MERTCHELVKHVNTICPRYVGRVQRGTDKMSKVHKLCTTQYKLAQITSKIIQVKKNEKNTKLEIAHFS